VQEAERYAKDAYPDQQGNRDSRQAAERDVAERRWSDTSRRSVRICRPQALNEDESTKGGDERRDGSSDDEPGVEHSHDSTNAEREENREPDWRSTGEGLGDNGRGETHHGADGEVEASCYQYEGLPDGHKSEDRGFLEDRRNVRDAEKCRFQDSDDDKQ
jgi:hypothetical protein